MPLNTTAGVPVGCDETSVLRDTTKETLCIQRVIVATYTEIHVGIHAKRP
jgi:hypothetical protein